MSLAHLEDWTVKYFESDIETQGFFLCERSPRLTNMLHYRNPALITEENRGVWDQHRKEDWELLPGLVSLRFLHGT